MLVVLIKLGARLRIVEPIEIGEEVRRVARFLLAPLQIVDDRLGVDFLLHVKQGLWHDEVGPVLPVLTAPDELRVADLDLALFQELLSLLL